MSATQVVSQLRAREGVLSLGAAGDAPTAITVRVTVPELWETIAVRCDVDTPVLAIKRAVLQELGEVDHPAEDFVVKLRGFEVLDESASVSAAGARDGSTFLVSFRRRRPVR